MSRHWMRHVLAFVGGGIFGMMLPSLFGELWLVSWTALLFYSGVQSLVLMALLPDETTT